MKRAQNKMNQQYEQQDHQSKKEGEINVTSDPKTKSSGEKGQLGDYVDFEDIKDNDTK